MAVKLIMRTSCDEFIDFIRNADERAAWDAIGDAALVVTWYRTGSEQRATLNRTIDLALKAYEQTFGQPWLPF
jgi:hypothetical protein